MKSWQTTLGGALSALGKTLIAVGVLPQLAGVPTKALTWIALGGFITDAVGGFFTALFAADAKGLEYLHMLVSLNTKALISGDTTHLKKEDCETK